MQRQVRLVYDLNELQFLFLMDQRVRCRWGHHIPHISQNFRLSSGGYVEFVKILHLN